MEIRLKVTLHDRNCEFCNESYSPKRQHQKYCSRICQKRAENIRNAERYRKKAREWYRENLERARIKRKEYYWKDPERFRKATREYWKTHREIKRKIDSEYKDKIRHDGKRQDMIQKNGYVCSRCGRETNSFNTIAHHSSLDLKDHAKQELLCRSCHTSLHMIKRWSDEDRV